MQGRRYILPGGRQQGRRQDFFQGEAHHVARGQGRRHILPGGLSVINAPPPPRKPGGGEICPSLDLKNPLVIDIFLWIITNRPSLDPKSTPLAKNVPSPGKNSGDVPAREGHFSDPGRGN